MIDIKNFPAPKKNKVFKSYWNKYLPKVVSRENFHEAHLDQLEVLCDMFIEYHQLTQFIQENGYVYSSDGRYGESHREFPQVKIKQKIIAELRQYSKQLGLVLEKDHHKNDLSDKDEWA